MSHGIRAIYQKGCRCLLCRSAEASYRAALRRRHLRQLPILGTLISPVEARRRIRQLRNEGYTKDRIAQMAGWRDGHLRCATSDRIRLATLVRIRRVARFAMLEGAELPIERSAPDLPAFE